MVSQTFWRKDGRYSWIILFNIALSRFIGISFAIITTGVFADEYPRHFGVEQAQTNVIGSTLLGVSLFSVPVNTIFLKVIGVRKMSIIGTVLTLAGIIPSAFATKIWHLVLSHSIVTCLGMSMSMTATLGIVRHYFDKHRGGAFAAIAVGAGVAALSFPAILSAMLRKFGYKYTILYISPIFLLNILQPLLFIEQVPLKKPKSVSDLLKSYIDTIKESVTPFFLLNSLLGRGVQLSVLVLVFSHISSGVNHQTAVISSTVFGFSYLVSSLSLTLVLLKLKLNCYVTQIIFNVTTGLACCLAAAFNIPMVYYICSACLGVTHGGILAIKGAFIIHIYPPDVIEYLYGLSGAVAGIGSFTFPLAGGYIQKYYGGSYGLYFFGAAAIAGGLMLVIAGLFRRDLWMSSHHNKDITIDILDKVGAIHAMAYFVVNAPNISPLQGQTCKRHKKDTVKKTGQCESVAKNNHTETCLTNK